jgi:hypothetical protein
MQLAIANGDDRGGPVTRDHYEDRDLHWNHPESMKDGHELRQDGPLLIEVDRLPGFKAAEAPHLNI